jgi:hypothetical protein
VINLHLLPIVVAYYQHRPKAKKIKEISDTIPVQRAEPQDWNTVFATNGMDLVLRNCITLIEVRTYVWFDTNLFWAFIFWGEGPHHFFSHYLCYARDIIRMLVLFW